MTSSNHFKLESDHHHHLIKALAEDIDLPFEEVNVIFVSALESLKSNARIQDYLSVLASKKVRDTLHH